MSYPWGMEGKVCKYAVLQAIDINKEELRRHEKKWDRARWYTRQTAVGESNLNCTAFQKVCKLHALRWSQMRGPNAFEHLWVYFGWNGMVFAVAGSIPGRPKRRKSPSAGRKFLITAALPPALSNLQEEGGFSNFTLHPSRIQYIFIDLTYLLEEGTHPDWSLDQNRPVEKLCSNISPLLWILSPFPP